MPLGFNNRYNQPQSNMNQGYNQPQANRGNQNQQQINMNQRYNQPQMNYNKKNNQQQTNSNQITQNPQLLQKPTVVPYLGKDQPINKLYELYQLSQGKQVNNTENTNQINQTTPNVHQTAKANTIQPKTNMGQPLSNFPFVTMPNEATGSLPVFRPLDAMEEESLPLDIEHVKTKEDKAEVVNSTLSKETGINDNDLIKNFIQNERNGNIFYDYLSSISKNKDELKHLKVISIQCKKHYDSYKNIYKKLFNEDFKEQNQIINTKVSYSEGLRLAAFAETDALRDLIRLVSLQSNTGIKDQLFLNLFEKLWTVNYLNLLFSRF